MFSGRGFNGYYCSSLRYSITLLTDISISRQYSSGIDVNGALAGYTCILRSSRAKVADRTLDLFDAGGHRAADFTLWPRRTGDDYTDADVSDL